MSPSSYSRQRGYASAVIIGIVLLLAVAAVALGIYLGTSRQPLPAAGPATPLVVSSTQLDFGLLRPRQPALRHFVLGNEGPASVDITFEYDRARLMLQPESLTLEPGKRSRIAVTLASRQAGEIRDSIKVLRNGVASESVVIGVLARIEAGDDAAPRIAVLGTPEGTGPAGAGRSPGTAGDTADASGADDAAMLEGMEENALTTADGIEGAPAAAEGEAEGDAALDAILAGAVDTAPTGPSSDRISRYVVTPYDPATSAPVFDLTELPPPASTSISDQEASEAIAKESRIRGRGDHPEDALPEDLDEDSDPLNDDPVVSPTLRVSGLSSVTLLGSTVQFYPHEVGVLGTGQAGPTSLSTKVLFPQVSLAFGELMRFEHIGQGAGTFDPSTGQMSVAVQVAAVDAEGDVAPFTMSLTTGTTFGRNADGIVFSLTGMPRSQATGVLRLVGVGLIPFGHKNSAEHAVVLVEILGQLDFGTGIGSLSLALPPDAGGEPGGLGS